MKTSEHSNHPICYVKFAVFLAIISVLMLGVGNALATTTTYTFNPDAANPIAWSTTNWSTTGSAPYDGTWVTGTNDAPSIANFNFGYLGPNVYQIITLNSETIEFGAGGGLTKQTGAFLNISGGTGGYSTLNFTGATINNADTTNVTPSVHPLLIFTGNINVNLSGATTTSTAASKSVSFQDNVIVTGDFTAGSGGTDFRMNTPYAGTATVAGFMNPTGNVNTTSTASNFIIDDGGTLAMTHSSGSRTLGSVQINVGQANSGLFRIGSTGSTSGTTIVSQLSGTGGTIRPNNPTNNTNGQLGVLVVDQTTNTTSNSRFQGDVLSGVNRTYMSLTKQGTGNLTLTGQINELQNVRVEGGGLWIDENNSGVTRSFANAAGGNGSAALTIADGGTFGGDFPTLGRRLDIVGTGGRNIVVESGGRLSPGLVDGSGNPTIGLLRIAFPNGGAFDLTDAVGNNNTGWLRFDLGANTTAGTTYDQINLTSGTLLIGNSLQFSDFNFNTNHAGFDEGVYTLFSLTGTADLDGSLNSDINLLSGIVGTSGLTGTLGLSGDDIILTVIPEPRASLLLLGAVVLWFVTRRRRMAC
jgi:hypothetical protein